MKLSKSFICKKSIIYLLSTLMLIDLSGQGDSNFDIYQYRYVGPTRGGRVTAVAGIASKPSTFYMGATGGGVWRTEDYGTSWENLSDGYFNTPSIGAIRVAQNDPNLIYVGTGTDGLRSNIITGKGMYKSIDEGESWSHIGLEKVGQIGAVEINPQNNNIVFVAAIGQAFNANKERGVYRTQDGGLSWKQVLHVSDTTGFSDLEFMPTNPNIIYAASWRAERKPWTIISGGKENGIWKSVDGGNTWERKSNGLPSLMGKIDLAVTPHDSKVVYALVEAPDGKGGLYKSNNQGESYTQVSDKFELLDRPFYYCNVDVDPNDVNTIYVNSTRFWKSDDGGKSWSSIRTPHGDNHDMWINPNNSDLIVQGNDGGANVTINGCKTWSHQLNQATAEIYQVEVDNQYPYWLYGGQQDNYSTVSVPSLPPYSHQAGPTGLIMNAGGCETGPAVPHPTKHHIVYSNCKGRFSVYNKNTGQEQSYDVGARYMYGHNPKDLKFRFQRVSPIHISPHDANVVYHTSQYVHRTTDEGKTWEIISPDLTAFEPDKQVRSGSPISNDITGEEFYSTIYAIRESSIEKGVIYVGANDGPIHVTRNGGEDWTNITPANLPSGGRVDCVEPSPHNNSKAYVSILRYQLGDWKPYIYKTNNYGSSWQLITDGIPSDYPVRVIREDLYTEGVLYAGTEYGMYISFDDGGSWEEFQQNLPITPITDIKLHRDDLALSTMGRGFWILDGVKNIISPTSKPTANTLYPINDAVRYRYSYRSSGSFSGAPSYPQPGVKIDYQLVDTVKGDFKVEILHADGSLVRSYSNKVASKNLKAERDMATNEIKYSYSTSLKNTPGKHRFAWDMKHFGAWDKSSSRQYQNGPYAAPGKYQVRLITGSDTTYQEFELKVDPRVLETGVTIDDISAQESLALKVTDLLSDAKRLSGDVSRQSKVAKKMKAESADGLQQLDDRLVRSKGRYTQVKFLNQINYLLGILRGADQRPGTDAVIRYEELKTELAEIQKEYDVLSKDMGNNKILKALIIDGQNNHNMWPKTTVMIKQYLEETGMFSVDVERTAFIWNGLPELIDAFAIEGMSPKTVTDKAQADPNFRPSFKDYDVVISNFGWGAAPFPQQTQKDLEEYVASGGGFVAIHAADNSWPEWLEFNKMIALGGWGDRTEKDGPYVYYDHDGKLVRDTSVGKGGAHGPQHEFIIQHRITDHPITKGLPKIWKHSQDELYDKLRGPALRLKVLGTAYSNPEKKGTNRHEPMLMTIDYGEGRVFHTPMGHADYSFECVGFITTLTRGCEWAATGKVSLDEVPADFPTADKSSVRPFKLKQ